MSLEQLDAFPLRAFYGGGGRGEEKPGRLPAGGLHPWTAEGAGSHRESDGSPKAACRVGVFAISPEEAPARLSVGWSVVLIHQFQVSSPVGRV